MSKSFSELKKNRKKNFEKVEKSVNKDTSGGVPKDETFWEPTKDKSGNASAVIRFLPAPPGEEVPYIKYWNHFFKGPTGRWYVENSLTTNGQTDPVSEYNSKQWQKAEETGNEELKKGVRNRKRKLNYVANIYVVSDAAAPENEGKVFKYRFGQKVFEKIDEAMHPKFDTDEPFNPFDFWEGKNFKVRVGMVKVNGRPMPNYDNCAFEDAFSELLEGDDEALKEIWESEYKLQPLIAPDQFKSYDELKKLFNAAMGFDDDYEEDEDEIPFDEGSDFTPKFNNKSKKTEEDEDEEEPPVKEEKKPKAEKPKKPAADDDDDDEAMEFFASLADDDDD